MRWFNFSILALLTLVLQVGLGRAIGLGPQRITPDLLLLLALVLAFRGPAPDVLLACWFLGLAKDLTSQAPLGVYAFGFGLLGLLIVRIRDFLYGENMLTQAGMVLVGSFLVEHLVFLVCVLKGLYGGTGYNGVVFSMMFSALFTAALAPYGQWLIWKLQRRLGLPERRRYGR
jgi:rod shape-determining protein MreD